jgi:hypothetical protein
MAASSLEMEQCEPEMKFGFLWLGTATGCVQLGVGAGAMK